ncbi:MAG TPA: hypothetical protein VGG70_02700 [Candidatus Cybelea sp.]
MVEMLARYGHIEKPKDSATNGQAKPGKTSPGKPEGLSGPVPAIGAEPKAEAPQPSLNEVAAKMIVDFGAVDAARRWCEWLIRTHQFGTPTVNVGMFLDKFPPALRNQYNKERATAVEALRAQVRSWIDRGTTTLEWERSKVSAAKKQPSAAPAKKETA